jgi:hypothetical protein
VHGDHENTVAEQSAVWPISAMVPCTGTSVLSALLFREPRCGLERASPQFGWSTTKGIVSDPSSSSVRFHVLGEELSGTARQERNSWSRGKKSPRFSCSWAAAAAVAQSTTPAILGLSNKIYLSCPRPIPLEIDR